MSSACPVRTDGPDDLSQEFALLRDHLAAISDFRKAKGKQYALPDVLSLVVLGLMSGCRSLSAISRYGKCHPEIVPQLGLRAVPSVPTLSRILAGVSPTAVREALRGFADDLMEQRGITPTVVAIDGKALRGVHEGTKPAHVLHLFVQQSAVVLDQVPVASVRGEVPAAEVWITSLAKGFPGLEVLTADALYADQNLCAAIVAQDFDYLIKLKKTS
jgi:hypothetical protein